MILGIKLKNLSKITAVIILNLLALSSVRVSAMSRGAGAGARSHSRSRSPERRLCSYSSDLNFPTRTAITTRVDILNEQLRIPTLSAAYRIRLCQDLISKLKADDKIRIHHETPPQNTKAIHAISQKMMIISDPVPIATVPALVLVPRKLNISTEKAT